MLTAVIFVSFAVAVNYIARYAAEKMPSGFKFHMPSVGLGFLSSPKYLIVGDNYYIMSTDMKTKMVDSNIDSRELPVLSGITINESRPEYVMALKQALAVDRKYLARISEVSLKNPDNIVMIDMDGARIIFGDSITREKLDNYMISLEKLDGIGRGFKTLDLRFSNRVIIN
jgi:hypothetical protein